MIPAPYKFRSYLEMLSDLSKDLMKKRTHTGSATLQTELAYKFFGSGGKVVVGIPTNATTSVNVYNTKVLNYVHTYLCTDLVKLTSISNGITRRQYRRPYILHSVEIKLGLVP